MGGSHLYCKLGIEILDFFTEESLVGTIFMQRMCYLDNYSMTKFSCSKHILWMLPSLEDMYISDSVDSCGLLVSIRGFGSDTNYTTIILGIGLQYGPYYWYLQGITITSFTGCICNHGRANDPRLYVQST